MAVAEVGSSFSLNEFEQNENKDKVTVGVLE